MKTSLKTSLYLNIALVGLILFVHAIGGHWVVFYQPADIAAILVIPSSLMAASFGLRRAYRALLTLSSNSDECNENIKALHMHRIANYATAAVLCIIHIMLAAYHTDQGIMVISHKFSISLLPILYAIVISEGFSKTAINRLSVHSYRSK